MPGRGRSIVLAGRQVRQFWDRPPIYNTCFNDKKTCHFLSYPTESSMKVYLSNNVSQTNVGKGELHEEIIKWYISPMG